ncbi:GDP-mannose-dependent alpha-(1-6)-phosphatidylinositol monomannoside mannosyltransferase, partial [termite gut metagenome]
MLHRLRQWDVLSSFRVDYFINNSNYVAKRIKKIYNREAVTIYPNVDMKRFELYREKEDFYLAS